MLRYALLAVAMRVAGRLPAVALYPLASCVGLLAYALNGASRRAVRANVARVSGPRVPAAARERHVRRIFRNAAWYWADMARLPRMTPQAVRAEIAFQGEDAFREVLAQGPAMLTSAHFSNAEFLLQCLPAFGRTWLGLIERLEPPPLFRFMVQLRSHQGNRFTAADRHGAFAAVRHLRDGGLIGVLADRDVTGGGVPVTICGAPVRLPPGPVELAMRFRAPVVLVSCGRLGPRRFYARFDVAFQPLRATDRAAAIDANLSVIAEWLEASLRRDPGQWSVLHPMWDGDPTG